MRILLVLGGLALSLSTAVAADEPWRDPDVRFKPVNEAIDKDDFKTAQDLLTDIRNAAKKLKDQEMLAQVAERTKEVSDLAKEFNKISPQAEIGRGSV